MEKGSVLARIQKLLALAASDNEHEAATAAALAQDMMLRHHIEEHELRARGETVAVEPIGTEIVIDYSRPISGTRLRKSGAVPYWHLRLVASLVRAFCCSYYYTPGHSITLVGRPSDRAAVVYLFNFLRVEIERFARDGWMRAQSEGRGELPRAADWTRAFCVGAADTVSERLIDPSRGLPAAVSDVGDEPATPQASTALILRERATEVQAWVEQNLKLSSGGSNRGGRARSTSGYHEGKAAGHALNLGGRGPRGSLGSGSAQ
jgi:hypothetical protein